MSASRTYRSTPGKSPRTLPESATGRPWAKYAGRSIQPRLDQAIANNPFASLRDQPSMLGASLTPTILTLPSSAPSASPNLSGAASSTPRSRRPPPPSSATRRKLARYEATSSSSQVGGQSHRPGRLGDISLRRYRKVLKDTIQGVTRGDLRRLARRGGVKRISAGIYDETRSAMRQFMKEVIGDAIACVELRRAQTMNFQDVIYALKRRGHTLYAFDTAVLKKSGKHD